MSEDESYPDVEYEDLGDAKVRKIERVQGMRSRAPSIIWGEGYKAWPIEKRLSYAERLASAQNHAADVLQKERNKLLLVVAEQENKLKQAARIHLSQGDLLHRELGAADAEKQELYTEIVRLKGQLKERDKTIRSQAAKICQLENHADRAGDH